MRSQNRGLHADSFFGLLLFVRGFYAYDVNRAGGDLFEVLEHEILLRLVAVGGVEIVVLHLLHRLVVGPSFFSTIDGAHIARSVASTRAVKIELASLRVL